MSVFKVDGACWTHATSVSACVMKRPATETGFALAEGARQSALCSERSGRTHAPCRGPPKPETDYGDSRWSGSTLKEGGCNRPEGHS